MKQLLLKVSALLFLGIAFYSCKKHDDDTVTQPGIFSITSPEPYQKVHKSDTINILATIKSEDEMHGYQIAITKDNGDTVYTKNDHTHSSQLNIDEKWVDTLAAADTLMLSITATLDHDGHTAVRSFSFTSQP